MDDSVADPGFSWGGCANSQKCYYFLNFADNYMKMKEFGPLGASLAHAPLDPPMDVLGLNSMTITYGLLIEAGELVSGGPKLRLSDGRK